MDNASPDLSGVLGTILENPETLKSAMEIAAKLKSSGVADAFQTQSGESYETREGAYSEERTAPVPVKEGAADERTKRRQLLGALRPYMSRERQERIDTILKVLQLLELAEQLGVIGRTP